jgi:hypothetical protein
MDNRGKAAALVGISAIGGLLAYYGYSQYGSDEEVVLDSTINNDNVVKEKETPSSDDTSITSTVTEYLSKMIDDKTNIKLEVEEKSQTTDNENEPTKIEQKELQVAKEDVEKVDDKKKWSKYWNDAYDKMENETKEPTAADFN